jgi:transposase
MSGMDTLTLQDPQDLRIAQLEAALSTSQAAFAKALERRLGLDSTNSSKPPSSDSPETRAQRRTKKSSGKLQGGQKGHDGHHRQLLDASRVHYFLDQLPPRCRSCGGSLSPDEVCDDHVREQTFDLPPITPIVTKHRRLRCRCQACGVVTRTLSMLAPGQTGFGPYLLGLLTYLSVAMHATRRATRELVTQCFGIHASPGSIQNALDSVLPAIAPLVHQARPACQRAGLVVCDKTDWSHQDKRAWVWCVRSEQAAFFKLQDKRDAAACWAILEPLEQRVVVSDRFGACGRLEAGQHQVCHVHLERDFAGMAKLSCKRGELGAKLERMCGQISVGHSDILAGERTLKDYLEWVKNEVRPSLTSSPPSMRASPPHLV